MGVAVVDVVTAFVRVVVVIVVSVVVVVQSGFGLSNWPIWTNFVRENFQWRILFLVKATKKIKTVLDPKIPHKNYRGGTC